RPDGVGDAYFERLTENVMRRVASETAPARAPIPIDRRKSDVSPEVEGKRAHAPKLSWAVLLSAGSAMAAVLVVAVLLVREPAVLSRAPQPTPLERSAPDAARLKGGERVAPPPPANDERQAALDRKQ